MIHSESLKRLNRIKMKTKEFVGTAILILLFILSIFVTNNFDPYIVKYLNYGIVGITIYIFFVVLATVVAPISATPLIPIAVALWGPLLTALINIFAWTIGSIITFVIARSLGKPIVARLINMETIQKYELVLGNKYLFWDVVFLRMALPVDILSYVIGLFSTMKMSQYILATLIGVTPFAFILSFASRGSLFFQITTIILVILFVYLGYRKINKLNQN